MSVRTVAVSPRVELQLHEQSTLRQYRELGGFVQSCIDEIERDTSRADWWLVKIVPDRACYCCDVIVQVDDFYVRARGDGFHGAVAGKRAFHQIEVLLREHYQAAAANAG